MSALSGFFARFERSETGRQPDFVAVLQARELKFESPDGKHNSGKPVAVSPVDDNREFIATNSKNRPVLIGGH